MSEKILKTVSAIERLTGIIIPNGWSSGFAVTSLSLACDGEREVGIKNVDEHPELLTLLRRQIEIVGTVINDGCFETVNVSEFKILNDNNYN